MGTPRFARCYLLWGGEEERGLRCCCVISMQCTGRNTRGTFPHRDVMQCYAVALGGLELHGEDPAASFGLFKVHEVVPRQDTVPVLPRLVMLGTVRMMGGRPVVKALPGGSAEESTTHAERHAAAYSHTGTVSLCRPSASRPACAGAGVPL